MFTLLIVIHSAFATSSFYHPNDIASISTEFARASEATSQQFTERASRANAIAGALTDYEEGLDLLGDRATAEQRARQQELKLQFNREFVVVTTFANMMAADFDNEFSSAMLRAIDAIAPSAVECLAMIPSASALPGIEVPLKKNDKCIGQNINEAVAKHMDTDAALTAAIDEIAALEWPMITLEPLSQPAVGGPSGSIQVLTTLRQIYRKDLAIIREQDEMARLPFQTAIEEGVGVDKLKELEAEASVLTQQTADKRARLAASVLDTSDTVMTKWSKKGFEVPGWCAQPELLGGCGENDRTLEVMKKLIADPKVAKSVGR